MINNIGRYILIGLGVLCLSIYVPQFFWKCFSTTTNMPYFIYSSKDKEICMIKKVDGKKVMINTTGDEYSRDQFEKKCPLFFNRQLVFSGNMPDSIHGVAIRKDIVAENQFYYWWDPSDLNKSKISLYPLIESMSGRVKLRTPKDFFRLGESIEFINCNINKVDKVKSHIFTKALTNEGFVFPAKDIFGNMSMEKPFDEGYFIIDQGGDLYHLKMMKNQAYCRKIQCKDNIKAKKVIVKESELMEFLAFMIDDKDNVYLISYEDYKLIKLPVDNYDSKIDKISISGNIFNRMITVSSNSKINFSVCDRDYNIIDSYSEKIITESNFANDISKYIIPFATYYRTIDDESISLRFTNPSWWMLIFNIILVILYSVYLYIYKYNIKYSISDIIIVLLFGIYGFICVFVFSKKKNVK